MEIEKKLGWRIELSLKVKGPKEGAVVGSVVYEDTTKDMAIKIQNQLSQLGIVLNSNKNV